MDITLQARLISRISPAAAPEPPAEDQRWVSAGIIDAHTHLAWTGFDHADQQTRDAEAVFAAQVRSYTQTALARVSAVRRCGGP